ncbi:hypothetical protein Dsin_009756 [Dipteronia sinensis]|uniref:Uncharacterized protein n=1 Tax=Dipteronia sinensis TaxID=43782 RepID=A0AAE0AR32_9ROSI|nr:hypothetical protein Dsin_009756 [Dipteronia sinensis]
MACSRVKSLLYDLYDEYLRVHGPSLKIDVPPTQNVSQSTSSSGFMNIWYNLLAKKTKKLRGYSFSSSNPYSKLESYQGTSFEFMEDSVVKNFISYTGGMIMKVKKNSTPVSTVAVEQEFSADGNILDAHLLLSPKSIQMQACIDDWTNAQNMQQEIDQAANELYDFFKDDQPDESGMDDHNND